MLVAPKQFKFAMGAFVKDRLTGFQGFVIARLDHVTGCTQYWIQPQAKKGNYVEGHYFDEDRLALIPGKAPFQIRVETQGADPSITAAGPGSRF